MSQSIRQCLYGFLYVKVIPYDLLVITIKFQSLRTYMPSAQNDYLSPKMYIALSPNPSLTSVSINVTVPAE